MNILSIDLDFLMPEIEDLNYENIEKYKCSPEEYWKKVKNQNNCKFSINTEAKFLLISILNQLNNNLHDVKVLTMHQEILDEIGDKTVNVVNIDQHHDIYYSYMDKHAVNDESQKHLLESSWVYYLYVKKQLESYTWITNNNAKYSREHLRYPFSFYFADELSYDNLYGYQYILEEQLENHYYDKIYFVKSPYYLPETDAIKEIFKCIDEYIQHKHINKNIDSTVYMIK